MNRGNPFYKKKCDCHYRCSLSIPKYLNYCSEECKTGTCIHALKFKKKTIIPANHNSKNIHMVSNTQIQTVY